MGFLDKVKNLFTEEYEVEETKPIKKEMVQVEIPAPVEDVKFELPVKKEIEEPVELPKEPVPQVITEPVKKEIRREEIRKPVFFDDSDFMDITKTQEVRRQPVQQPEPVKKETYGIKKVEEKKKFSPTPIISPVYGILDKNYHKEDITSKRPTRTTSAYTSSRKKVTLDEVRNKAFGTLEDELETTLISNSILFSELKDEPKKVSPIEEELFDDLTDHELRSSSYDDMEVEVTEDDTINKNMTLEELENMERNKTRLRRTKKVTVEETEDSISNRELFDLIDSMYDRGDE